MKCNDGVLIATPRSDGEATAFIGVHLAGGILIDVDLAGQDLVEEGYGVSVAPALEGLELVGLV